MEVKRPIRLRRRLSVDATIHRDLVVFKKQIDWRNTEFHPYKRIEYFKDVDKKEIQGLLAYGHNVTLQDPQFMPLIADMLNFCNTYSHYKFHGYVIGPYCSDTQVCIEGIEFHGDHPPTEQEVEHFRKLFAEASELTIAAEDNTLRAWYD